jgi:hypothetical protein
LSTELKIKWKTHENMRRVSECAEEKDEEDESSEESFDHTEHFYRLALQQVRT